MPATDSQVKESEHATWRFVTGLLPQRPAIKHVDNNFLSISHLRGIVKAGRHCTAVLYCTCYSGRERFDHGRVCIPVLVHDLIRVWYVSRLYLRTCSLTCNSSRRQHCSCCGSLEIPETLKAPSNTSLATVDTRQQPRQPRHRHHSCVPAAR